MTNGVGFNSQPLQEFREPHEPSTLEALTGDRMTRFLPQQDWVCFHNLKETMRATSFGEAAFPPSELVPVLDLSMKPWRMTSRPGFALSRSELGSNSAVIV